jgi:hypothetical protein
MERDMSGESKQVPFFTSIPLDALVEIQGVQPVHNLDQISSLWPVDDDPDRMLAHILDERSAR